MATSIVRDALDEPSQQDLNMNAIIEPDPDD
jgi:hypothetical protein